MYSIFTYIWVVLYIKVGKYAIRGATGIINHWFRVVFSSPKNVATDQEPLDQASRGDSSGTNVTIAMVVNYGSYMASRANEPTNSYG